MKSKGGWGNKHLERTLRENFSAEITFHQTWAWEKRQTKSRRKNIPGRGKSQGKGPEVES